jgi:hypothetical protein
MKITGDGEKRIPNIHTMGGNRTGDRSVLRPWRQLVSKHFSNVNAWKGDHKRHAGYEVMVLSSRT